MEWSHLQFTVIVAMVVWLILCDMDSKRWGRWLDGDE